MTKQGIDSTLDHRKTPLDAIIRQVEGRKKKEGMRRGNKDEDDPTVITMRKTITLKPNRL